MKKNIIIFALPLLFLILALLELTTLIITSYFIYLILAAVFVVYGFIQFLVKEKIIVIFLMFKYMIAMLLFLSFAVFLLILTIEYHYADFQFFATVFIYLIAFNVIAYLFVLEYKNIKSDKENAFLKNAILLCPPLIFAILILQQLWFHEINPIILWSSFIIFIFLGLLQPLLKNDSKQLRIFLIVKYALAISIMLTLIIILPIRGYVGFHSWHIIELPELFYVTIIIMALAIGLMVFLFILEYRPELIKRKPRDKSSPDLMMSNI